MRQDFELDRVLRARKKEREAEEAKRKRALLGGFEFNYTLLDWLRRGLVRKGD